MFKQHQSAARTRGGEMTQIDRMSETGCTIFASNDSPSASLREILNQSLSPASKSAFRSDVHHFLEWGGTIPSSPQLIAEYAAAMSSSFKVATISRRLASIAKAHRIAGLDNPVQSEIVRTTVKGIRRMLGVAQREAKPLLKEDLLDILVGTGSRLKDLRDRALLLIGFAGGFRRSELVSLDVEDIERVRQGIVVTLRKSKTDQESRGRKVGIPLGRGHWCPVVCLEEWLSKSGISTGPIFRAVNKHSQLQKRMSGEAVSLVLKERLAKIGRDSNSFSGHSLRSGFATSAAISGASSFSIRQQTGHTSDAMLARYIRRADLFKDNAVMAVL